MTDLEVLFFDDDIVVINKPSGLLSVPGRYEPDCAVSRLEQQFGTILVIHRLDMDTSGILVFARNKTAQANIQRQFERQTTRKVYEALVYGQVKGNWGCINMPIIVDWPNRPLQMISHTQGRYALTRWQKQSIEGEYCRVRLLPKTGRSHQLRIHMQQLGHPIVGDSLYATGRDHTNKRLCLHARELDFDHPVTTERMVFLCKAAF
ncbi:hypothetical protein A3759_13590 [Thalassolituus sp. HI0120]|nr:hypothetical protein A3759_13590 [Thalassolituus sp. HI0120]